ncbi:MAG: hypothetical protein HY423_00150 [Candidatus Lambdaproteobacteria bacterium]|nr:hypothetical protein [Candidatus Lambdaproteobacteria bacterium]
MHVTHPQGADHCAAPAITETLHSAPTPHAAALPKGWGWGMAAALALALLYGATLSLLNGPVYMWQTFLALWYWMVPLVAGFGLQVGLFGYSRALARAGVSPHASGVAASGGTSALAMVACCAHHLADVLPLVGLAGAALFLSSYQSLFLLAGVLSNGVGIAFLLGEMQKHRLYAQEGRLLAPLLRWPVRLAVPYLAGLALLVMAVAITWEVWA